MSHHLGPHRGMLFRPNLWDPARARPGGDRAALPPCLLPTAQGAGVDAEPGDDLSRWPPGVDGGQGSFTEIGGMMRALHPSSLPNGHIIRKPL